MNEMRDRFVGKWQSLQNNDSNTGIATKDFHRILQSHSSSVIFIPYKLFIILYDRSGVYYLQRFSYKTPHIDVNHQGDQPEHRCLLAKAWK